MAAESHGCVEMTIVSAKHLKNVNWREGPLVPYVALYLSPNHRFSTRPDDSNSTSPVWNDRFLLPFSSFSSPDSILSLDLFHFPPSDATKPLVASLRIPSASLLPPDPPSSILHSLRLLRPSGRPQGKLKLKVSLRPPPPPPPPPSPLRATYPYSSHPHSDYYPHPPPPPPPQVAVHAYVLPLPHAPPPPVDYRIAPPPPPTIAAYHRDGNSDESSVYRPSAPVDFTYPAKEYQDCTVSPPHHFSTSHATFPYVTPSSRWITDRTDMWRNDQNSVSLEHQQWAAPAPAAVTPAVYEYRRGLEDGSISIAFGGLRLDEGNRGYRMTRTTTSSNHGYGRED